MGNKQSSHIYETISQSDKEEIKVEKEEQEAKREKVWDLMFEEYKAVELLKLFPWTLLFKPRIVLQHKSSTFRYEIVWYYKNYKVEITSDLLNFLDPRFFGLCQLKKIFKVKVLYKCEKQLEIKDID